MPISYTVDTNVSLITVHIAGLIQLSDFESLFKSVSEDPLCRSAYRVLVDARNLGEFSFKPEDMALIAQLDDRLPREGTLGRKAIVCADVEALRLITHYESSLRSARHVRTFTSLPPALAWLDVPDAVLGADLSLA